MAREIIIRIRDDLDRTLEADEEVKLTIDGVTYILDLCTPNAQHLRELLRPWLEAAHERIKEPHAKSATGARMSVEQRQYNKNIRKWAKRNGYEISNTGQIPLPIRDAYEEMIRRDAQAAHKREETKAHKAYDHPGGGDLARSRAIPDKKLRDAIRAWGSENGFEVANRGFLPGDLIRAYQDAHAMAALSEVAASNGVGA